MTPLSYIVAKTPLAPDHIGYISTQPVPEHHAKHLAHFLSNPIWQSYAYMPPEGFSATDYTGRCRRITPAELKPPATRQSYYRAPTPQPDAYSLPRPHWLTTTTLTDATGRQHRLTDIPLTQEFPHAAAAGYGGRLLNLAALIAQYTDIADLYIDPTGATHINYRDGTTSRVSSPHNVVKTIKARRPSWE